MTDHYSPEAIDSDIAALAAVCMVAEEALALHREALTLVAEGWSGESGSAATVLLLRQCGEAADLVAALDGTARDLRSLRDTVGQSAGLPTDVAVYGRAYDRLGERPTARFEIPDPAPLLYPPSTQPSAQPPIQPFQTWTPSVASLPNLGGALAGLAAQIAGAASQAGSSAVGTVFAAAGQADLIPQDTTGTAPARRSGANPELPAAQVRKPALPVVPPAEKTAVRPGIPTAAPDPAEPPLLAAERPPEPGGGAALAPEPATGPAEVLPPARPPDSRTPCEIAADELPQVGQ